MVFRQAENAHQPVVITQEQAINAYGRRQEITTWRQKLGQMRCYDEQDGTNDRARWDHRVSKHESGTCKLPGITMYRLVIFAFSGTDGGYDDTPDDVFGH